LRIAIPFMVTGDRGALEEEALRGEPGVLPCRMCQAEGFVHSQADHSSKGMRDTGGPLSVVWSSLRLAFLFPSTHYCMYRA
jgi:hypothetical protein